MIDSNVEDRVWGIFHATEKLHEIFSFVQALSYKHLEKIQCVCNPASYFITLLLLTNKSNS